MFLMMNIEESKEQFLAELFDFLSIPSVSADPAFKADVDRCAEFVKAALLKSGADQAEIIPTEGHSIVYAERIIDPKLPTVLVYGHYDVQPADPLELWHTEPFEPEIRNGKIYARGACDDKGQVFMHVKALEVLTTNEELKCNVKFLIEGEEEIGSDNLEVFVRANQEKLACDMVLISDTGIVSNDCPSITTGLRGLSYVEVEVTGPNRDLHSGMYGGAVANPINVLSQMIASLHNEAGEIQIPGFYDGVQEVSKAERDAMAQSPITEEEFKKSIDIKDTGGEKSYSYLERIAIRPTLDVNGIWGGYIGEGAKTVLPSKAYAKISMRLVPNQSSAAITELFTKHFESIAPEAVTVKVTPHHGGEPALTPVDSVAYRAGEMAFEEVWGKKPIPMREGGSIPIVSLFEKQLGINVLLLGFGLDEDAIHSPNESYGIFNFMSGIKTICSFYKHYNELMTR